MVAAPQFFSMTFRGQSGRHYSKDGYLSDVAAARGRFDGGAGASSTSPEYWVAPEPVVLVDYAQVTGMTDTTKIQVTRNGVATGDILRYAVHLTSLATRPALRIGFRAGQQIGVIQLA